MPESTDYEQAFFEDLSADESLHERLFQVETAPDNQENIGLSQDSVYKLTEDILNPMPPSD